jgi:hypothetical protein
MKTPKSKDTPQLISKYNMEILRCSLHKVRFIFFEGVRWVLFIAGPLSAFEIYLFLLSQYYAYYSKIWKKDG